MSGPTYHDQEDVIGFCADYRHPWGCQDSDVNAYGKGIMDACGPYESPEHFA